MTLLDITRTDVVTAPRETAVTGLARLMRDEGVGSVVVTDESRPVGVVTDRDLAIRVLADEEGLAGLTASDVMTSDPVTVSADAGVFELTELMRTAAVRRVPVVDGDVLVGIVTLDDVTRLLVGELDNLDAVVEAEMPTD